jgi:hypothetical protein
MLKQENGTPTKLVDKKKSSLVFTQAHATIIQQVNTNNHLESERKKVKFAMLDFGRWSSYGGT